MKITDPQAALNMAQGESILQRASELAGQKVKTEYSPEDKQRLSDSSQEFEAMLVNLMISEMRKGIASEDGQEGLFGDSQTTKVFRSMLDYEYSKALADHEKLGFAEQIMEQFGIPVKDDKYSLQAPSDIFSGISSLTPGLPESSSQNAGNFLRPAAGAISSGFGMRIHPLTQKYQMHQGIDIAMPTGTRIHAAESGRVAFAGHKDGYGQAVVIEHPDGYQTIYGHLSDIGVEAGDVVRRGEILGLSGNTGRSTGPHLHFEILKDGRRLDPEGQW